MSAKYLNIKTKEIFSRDEWIEIIRGDDPPYRISYRAAVEIFNECVGDILQKVRPDKPEK